MSDSGPNLGVRGVGFLLVLAGLLLISTGYRIRKGTSRVPIPPTMVIHGIGIAAFTLGGAIVIAFGTILLGVGI